MGAVAADDNLIKRDANVNTAADEARVDRVVTGVVRERRVECAAYDRFRFGASVAGRICADADPAIIRRLNGPDGGYYAKADGRSWCARGCRRHPDGSSRVSQVMPSNRPVSRCRAAPGALIGGCVRRVQSCHAVASRGRLSRGLGGRSLRRRAFRDGLLGRRLRRRGLPRRRLPCGPRPWRLGVTDYRRDAVSEDGGVLLDDVACCAVACAAPFGGLGHRPRALLAHPGVP